MWHDVSYPLKTLVRALGTKRKKISFHFPFSFDREREEERGEREQQAFSLRSTEFCRLDFIGVRLKVHYLDEGYVWVPKGKDFDEDLKEEIRGKWKFSSLGGVIGTSYYSSTLQEVEILPLLVLVPIYGLIFGLDMVEYVWAEKCLK